MKTAVIQYSMLFIGEQLGDILGCFAISKVGHDKGECYVIVAADKVDGFVMVANGKNRKLETPKRKNLRHLFVTKQHIDVRELLNGEMVSGNLKLATRIKEFRKMKTEN